MITDKRGAKAARGWGWALLAHAEVLEAQSRQRRKPERQKPNFRGPTPSDTRSLTETPEGGLADFLRDPKLLPMKPPGWKPRGVS